MKKKRLKNCRSEKCGASVTEHGCTPSRTDPAPNFTGKQPDTPEILSVHQGLQRVGGRKDLYFRLLQAFEEDFQDIHTSLRHSFEVRDFETLRRTNHSLKGVSGNLGVLSLYQSTKVLSDLIKNGAHALIPDNIARLEKELKTALDAIRALLSKAAET